MKFQLPSRISERLDDFTGRTWLLPRILEWLDGAGRLLLIVGEPGSGKSMISAWLSGGGPLPADAGASAQLARVRDAVCAVHFCDAASSNSPKSLAENLAQQLASTVDGFAGQAALSLSDGAKVINVSGTVTVGNAEPDSRLTGVELTLNLGALTDEPSFQRALIEPLKALYRSGRSGQMLIIIDALDEALTYAAIPNIVQMLNRLGDLPPECRFLATARDDTRVRDALPRATSIHLDRDEPAADNAIRQYCRSRLGALDDGRRAELSDLVTEAAGGQFLYARLLLEDVAGRLPENFDPATWPLPKGLAGIYEEFFSRDLKADNQRWYQSIRPVLGLVAVGLGYGLTRDQLRWFARFDVAQPLELLSQYLDTRDSAGPFKIFHQSLGEFLREKQYIDPPAMHGTIADYYQSLRNGAPAWKRWDRYAFLHTPAHLAGAAGTNGPEQIDRVAQLVALVLDPGYKEQRRRATGDMHSLQLDIQRAMGAAAACDYGRAVVLVTEAALGLAKFRVEELRPEPLFNLARGGNALEAARLAGLYEMNPQWRQAVPLILAWCAVPVNAQEAAQLRNSVQVQAPAYPLTGLMARLDAALGRTPLPRIPPLPAAEPEWRIRQRVDAMTGAGGNAELVSHHELTVVSASGGPHYLATSDGPQLVSYAVSHPADGDIFLHDYIGAHTSYQYVYYRQESLWALLGAVLLHPSQQWVRDMSAEIAISALAGSSAEFREALPLTILALTAAESHSGAPEALNARIGSAFDQAGKLFGGPHGDQYAFHKRRLAAIAQLGALLPVGPGVTASQTALNLPYGFAGYQSPGSFNLAEVIRICSPAYNVTADFALRQAGEAAQNITDPAFRMKQTSRVNAMLKNWWPRLGLDVRKWAPLLAESPEHPDFTALHVISETGAPAERALLPMPNPATLDELAQAYHQPVDELVRVNDGRWQPGEKIMAGEVRITDPGFLPHIAARVAAEALVQPGLDSDERVSLIRRIVPRAAVHRTSLDTVLARLLLAARPSGSDLVELERIAGEFPDETPSAPSTLIPS